MLKFLDYLKFNEDEMYEANSSNNWSSDASSSSKDSLARN